MERNVPGLVVPIPTFPLCITLKSCPWAPTKSVLVATSADEVVVPVTCVLPACTERREPGVAVPTPSLALSVSKERRGMLDVEFANEKALIVEVEIVVVASCTMLMIVLVDIWFGEEEPMVIRLESK